MRSEVCQEAALNCFRVSGALFEITSCRGSKSFSNQFVSFQHNPCRTTVSNVERMVCCCLAYKPWIFTRLIFLYANKVKAMLKSEAQRWQVQPWLELPQACLVGEPRPCVRIFSSPEREHDVQKGRHDLVLTQYQEHLLFLACKRIPRRCRLYETSVYR